MKYNFYKRFAISLVVISVLSCGGSKPSRYYLLTTQKDLSNPVKAGKDLKIGVGPIQFPEYLRRPQIVSFLGTQRLDLAEYDRWAEPLDENFGRILAENLTLLIATEKVFIYPFLSNDPLDYRIIIEIRQFEMNVLSQVKLIAQWQIFQGAMDNPIVTKRSVYLESVNSENYESIITGMSKLTASLSREIAETINSLP